MSAATPPKFRQLKIEVLLRLFDALPRGASVEVLRDGRLVIEAENGDMIGHVSFDTQRAIVWDPDLRRVSLSIPKFSITESITKGKTK